MNKELVDDLFDLLKSSQRSQALDIILANSLSAELHRFVTTAHIRLLVAVPDSKSIQVLTNFSSVPSLVSLFDKETVAALMKQKDCKVVLGNISAQTEDETLFFEHLKTFLSSEDHLSILVNLSRFENVRSFLFENQSDLGKFYSHSDFVLLLLNLLFEVERHDSMPLSSIIEFVVSILFRELKNVQFSEEELPHFEFVETLPKVACAYPLECIQCLLLVGTALSGRKELRAVNSLYPTLREFHKQCEDEDLKAEIEKLVGYLIREDEEESPLQHSEH